jgi:exopolysaccharide biosynthesis polyprenyl glycosylphosphotransferase
MSPNGGQPVREFEPVPVSPFRGPSGSRTEFSLLRRTGPWRDALRRRMLALADASGVVVAMLMATFLSGGAPLHVFWSSVTLPLWLVLAKFHGLYDRDHQALRHLTSDELPSIITWAVIGTALLTTGFSVLVDEPVVTSTAIAFCLTIAVVTPVLRACARRLWRLTVPKERAVIVGRGPLEAATRRKLELFADMHIEIAATIDDADLEEHGELMGALAEAGRGSRVERIILASQTIDEHRIAELVSVARAGSIKLSVVPPARGMFGTAVRLGHVADLPLIEYSTWDVGRSTMLIKRTFDVVASLVVLALVAPLMALIAVAIRLDSSGPSLFRQVRAGMDGKPFLINKFRTMTPDAEQRLGELVKIEALVDPSFKFQHDPRVTRLGRFLRRTSLDELPQLINVLRGDMSLVGPRPEQMELVNRYEDEHRFRLSVKPGVTGPMQVYGRGALRFDERLAVERDYVENYSLRRDIRILLLTASVVVGGGGAY